MSAWRLLITRPAADCALLAAQLAEQQIYSSSLPLLAMRELAETASQRALLLNLDQYHAIVVVSKPAARLILERLDRYWVQPPLHPTWFTVGAASGKILQQQGLVTHWPDPHDGDDSEALLALPSFQQSLTQAVQPRVLIVRGSTGREFLANTLKAQQVQVDFLPIYQRYLPDYAADELIQRINQEQLNGIAVSSEQSLLNLLKLAADKWNLLQAMPLFVPSARVAATAKHAGAQQVINCQGASNQKLIAALHHSSSLLKNKD